MLSWHLPIVSELCRKFFVLASGKEFGIFLSFFCDSVQLSEDCVDLFGKTYFLVQLPSQILMGMQILGLMALDINKCAEVLILNDKNFNWAKYVRQ